MSHRLNRLTNRCSSVARQPELTRWHHSAWSAEVDGKRQDAIRAWPDNIPAGAFSVVEGERTSALVPVSALAADRYDVMLPRSVKAASFRANAELAGALPGG